MNEDRLGLLAGGLILLVRGYQKMLAPFVAGQCRFYPTCSNYSIEALRRHGAVYGSYLTVRRLLRCQPLGGQGADPVPPRRVDRHEHGGRSHNE